tara:strand:- start:934 stop:1149 length:216 start_codon:yes stop_codon:yes gene_type:complete
MKKVEGTDNLVSPQRGIYLNINNDEIEAARYRKRLRKEKESEMDRVKNSVNELKNDVGEIKSLLTKLAEKL